MSVISTRDHVPQIARPAGGLSLPRAAAPPAAGMTGQDVLRVIRKRKWLIVISLLVAGAASVGVTALWWMYYPLYTASAYLRVNPPEQVPGERGYSAGDILERNKQTLAKVAKKEAVFKRTIDNTKVKQTTWYQEHVRDPIPELDDVTEVVPIRETDLLVFSMTGPKPEELPEIVNAWAAAFVDDCTTVANERTDAIANLVLKEQQDVKAKLVEVDTSINALLYKDERIIQQSITTRTQDSQALLQQKTQIDLAKMKAERDKQIFEDQERQNLLDTSPIVQQAMDQDTLLRGLNNELVSTTMAQESLIPRVGREHRSVMDMGTRIGGLEQQIAERKGVVRESIIALMKDSYSRQIDALVDQERALARRLDDTKAAIDVLQDSQAKISYQMNKKRSLESQNDSLVRRLLDLNLLKRVQPTVLYSPAITPTEPSIPRPWLNVLLGLLLGLVVGVGLAFLLEFTDTSIKSPSDVQRRVDLPMLGMIPHQADLDEEIEDLRLAFLTHPNSLVGEAFRQVRTTLQFSAPASQLRTILVTSALPGDGRTTVSLNLAAATAHGGRKVLVVEANFRQPAVRRLFPQVPEAGLSNVLVGQAHWKDLVREVQPNLFVLSAGPLPPNPSELLGSDAMRTLLAELVGQFDQVFLDGAPCLLVTDSAVLGTLVDGVVMVVRATANTYGVVQRARDLLSRVGARNFGVVLNGIRVTAGGYLRKNYRTFYEYQTQDPGAPPAP